MSESVSTGGSSSKLSQFGIYKSFDARTEEFMKLSKRRQIRQGCACAVLSTIITVVIVAIILLTIKATEYNIIFRQKNKKQQLWTNPDNESASTGALIGSGFPTVPDEPLRLDVTHIMGDGDIRKKSISDYYTSTTAGNGKMAAYYAPDNNGANSQQHLYSEGVDTDQLSKYTPTKRKTSKYLYKKYTSGVIKKLFSNVDYEKVNYLEDYKPLPETNIARNYKMKFEITFDDNVESDIISNPFKLMEKNDAEMNSDNITPSQRVSIRPEDNYDGTSHLNVTQSEIDDIVWNGTIQNTFLPFIIETSTPKLKKAETTKPSKPAHRNSTMSRRRKNKKSKKRFKAKENMPIPTHYFSTPDLTETVRKILRGSEKFSRSRKRGLGRNECKGETVNVKHNPSSNCYVTKNFQYVFNTPGTLNMKLNILSNT